MHINNKIDRNLWNDLLNQSEFASPFQTPEFFDFFNQNVNMQAKVFAVGNNVVYDALCVLTFQKEKGLKGFFSRRAIIYGGPVLSENIKQEELEYLLIEMSNYVKRKVIYVETRNFFDYSQYKDVFLKSGWHYIPYLNFQLNLVGLNKETLLSKFKYNRRREIKQSISEGTTYGLCDNIDELKHVYSILRTL